MYKEWFNNVLKAEIEQANPAIPDKDITMDFSYC